MKLNTHALSMLACTALLSACGGGGGLDDSDSKAPPTVSDATTAAAKAGSVSTLADARKVANLLLPLLSPNVRAVPGKAAAAPEASAEPATSAKAAGPKAVEACSGGGTMTDSQQTSVDVDSPYTDQPFDLSVLSYSLCKTAGSSDTETTVTGLNGQVKDGEVDTEENQILYSQNGESPSAPLRISVQHQPKSGVSGPTFTVNTETYGVFHSQFGTSSRLRQRYYVRQGLVNGSEGGETFNAAFVIKQGISPSNPMLVSSPSTGGLAHQGAVAVALLSEPADITASCGNGSFTINNLAPLKDLDDSEAQRLEGSIQVLAGGQTATYTFSGDGSLEITAGNGSKLTINQTDLIDECPILRLF